MSDIGRTRSHVAVQHFCRKQHNYSSPKAGRISLRDDPCRRAGSDRGGQGQHHQHRKRRGQGEDANGRDQHDNLHERMGRSVSRLHPVGHSSMTDCIWRKKMFENGKPLRRRHARCPRTELGDDGPACATFALRTALGLPPRSPQCVRHFPRQASGCARFQAPKGGRRGSATSMSQSLCRCGRRSSQASPLPVRPSAEALHRPPAATPAGLYGRAEPCHQTTCSVRSNFRSGSCC